ncbi:class I tRNA ligase family protein, partial [Candidatus Uhrbacteria bacterium]|nr:class I tRNA ligase family protein [Candidatus Uhrbacteria bacterium]
GKSLKDLALAAVRDQEIQILPERFTKEYFHWMEHLRDWCISRQIWFGHRLPVWYRGDEVCVGTTTPEGSGWEQDPDTLDTWFSSGMWTFSTLGWPDAAVTHPDGRIEKSGDLAAFHPTAVLETGYDILFFWVARMILMTEFALGEVPFRTVYLHGLVRDAQGRKMSKSLGNVIDPLDMVGKYGADAVRLALFIGTAPGMDTKLDEQKIAGYAKFTTKIWNIARYVSMLIGDAKVTGQISDIPESQLTAADRWVLARCWATIAEVSAAYQSFECARGAQAAYDFAWHEFADWYIEATKIDRRPHHPILLLAFLETILKLLHPAMPFVTEALWERTRSHRNGDESTLITSPWPTTSELPEVADAGAFAFAQEVATAIRQVRNEDQIPPKILLEVTLIPRVSQEQEWCNDAEVIALLRGFVRAAWVRCANADGAPRIVVRSTDVYVRAADEAAS